MKKIAPSILAADFKNLEQQIRAVEIGGADIIHCDIMDGKFVPNITFGPIIVSSVNEITNLPLDVHLMVEKPQHILEDFVKAGANYITVHQEEVIHLDRVLNQIKELGAKAGVALNPATSVETLEPILHLVDLVLIMSVNPGFGGQSFIPYSLSKIKKLDKLRKENNYKFEIEIDGGVNKKTIKDISDAGCDIFVAGSAIFSSENITAETTKLKNIVI
ncbi:MAG: ribulose-phosphate 3-epimerase [Ignavibacteriae bacterium]|nr:ribulose-phosphate 3-epimerase [Ignavibacteriota bacterium]